MKEVQVFPCGKVHCVLGWASGMYTKLTVFQNQFLCSATSLKVQAKWQIVKYEVHVHSYFILQMIISK